jgi:DNA (cytosine-5)-methyltransferase 1
MKIRTLDLFAGCGGSSAGATAAGAKVVAAIDAWPLATSTYKKNFPSAYVATEFLAKINPKKLRKKIGRVDLLLASPECTNHTLAKGSARRSEASRETAFQVLRFAREFKPKWIVVENVVRMNQWRKYKAFIRSIGELGYRIREQVLNAKQFGVAQDRKRLFILCSLLSDPSPVRSTRRERSVKEILDGKRKWKSSHLLEEGRAPSTIARYCNGLERMGEKKSFLLVYYGTDAGGGWQPLNRPLRTVTTVDRFALITPNGGEPLMRMLQVTELKKAMGFNSAYQLDGGTRRDKIKLLGNAVCPPVMEAIVRSLIQAARAGS